LFNFKLCGIAAGTAFVLSLLVGIISGSGILVLLMRALLFGVLFFVLTCLIFWLLGQFVPELLNVAGDDLDIPVSGSHVNISVGESISGAFPTDNSESVDDIGGSSSSPAPLDQGVNAGYTEERGLADGFGSPSAGGMGPSATDPRGPSQATIPDNGEDMFPDMDGFSEASTFPSEGVDLGMSFDAPETPKKSPSSNRGKQALAGAFNPKELAQAIQTVLKKDEKG
jgi:hypothetical protein